MKLDIHHFESLPSTQDSAIAYLADGACEGLVIIADEQTAGRGRYDRTWQSLKGNLLTSIVLEPSSHEQAPPLKDYGQLGIVIGVAIRQAIVDYATSLQKDVSSLQLKWPNDGLYNGAKLFGLLIENVEGFLVVGIGLNVNESPDLDYATTCLKNILKESDALDLTPVFHSVLKSVFAYYRRWLKGEFQQIAAEFEAVAYQLGSEIERLDAAASKTIKGVFDGLAADGAMRLRVEGKEVLVYSVNN